MKKLLCKVAPVIAAVALATTKNMVNSTCSWVYFQAKLPEAAQKLRKH